MKKRTLGLLLVLIAAFGAEVAQAQVFTPTFMAPRAGGDLGIYLSDGPGDFSIEGIWRRNFGGYDLGFRGGVADRGDALLLLGAEFRNPLQVSDIPLQMAVTGGIQGAIGDGGAAGFQFGLTLGYAFTPDNFVIIPYIHPRIGLVNGFGRDDLDLEVLADIGFDFEFAQNLIVRIGFGLGSPTADWGIGFAWR